MIIVIGVGFVEGGGFWGAAELVGILSDYCEHGAFVGRLFSPAFRCFGNARRFEGFVKRAKDGFVTRYGVGAERIGDVFLAERSLQLLV